MQLVVVWKFFIMKGYIMKFLVDTSVDARF